MPEERSKRRHSVVRIELVLPFIEKKLTSVDEARRVLEVLVSEAEKERSQAELWQGLHDAAVRDDMLVELSFAYEQLVNGKRLAQVAPAVQGEVLMHSASFFLNVLGDTDKAMEAYRRVLAVAPENAEAFSRLERHLLNARNHFGVAELYATVAAGRGDRSAQLLARRAVEMIERLPSEHDRAIRLGNALLPVDPGHRPLWRLLEARCRKAARLRDAADYLEREISQQPPSDPAELLGLRLRLVLLCMGQLKDYEGAVVQVEAILRQDPAHDEARKVAERLLAQSNVAPRAAAILNERRRRLAVKGG